MTAAERGEPLAGAGIRATSVESASIGTAPERWESAVIARAGTPAVAGSSKAAIPLPSDTSIALQYFHDAQRKGLSSGIIRQIARLAAKRTALREAAECMRQKLLEKYVSTDNYVEEHAAYPIKTLLELQCNLGLAVPGPERQPTIDLKCVSIHSQLSPE